MSDGISDGLWDVESAAEKALDKKPRLKFRYVNWRGEDHEYLVSPRSMQFTECGCFPDEPHRPSWAITADVRERDGQSRPGTRTFALIKMREVEEVPANG